MPIELKIPVIGESITEVEIGDWLKRKGESVQKDEPVVTLESEKATVELPAPAGGTVTEVLKKKGDTAKIGEVIAYIEDGVRTASPPANDVTKKADEAGRAPTIMPAAAHALAENKIRADEVQPSGPGGRLLKEDVLRQVK